MLPLEEVMQLVQIGLKTIKMSLRAPFTGISEATGRVLTFL